MGVFLTSWTEEPRGCDCCLLIVGAARTPAAPVTWSQCQFDSPKSEGLAGAVL